LNQDSRKALAEIASKVDQVRGDLPRGPGPGHQHRIGRLAVRLVLLSFSSDILQQNEITDYLVRVVQPRLSALGGVQRADILGGRTFAMRIWLKPDRMAALNVSPVQVRQALSANNFLSAVGQTKGSLIQVNLTANTDLRSVPEFKQLVIRNENGTLVRLGDVADVVLGAEDYGTEVRFSGQTAVFMGVWVLPNSNSLDVIKAVRGEVDKIKADLPTSMKAAVAYDATAISATRSAKSSRLDRKRCSSSSSSIFLLLGLVPLRARAVVAIPVSLVGAVF
jgi:multidrug efflux pump